MALLTVVVDVFLLNRTSKNDVVLFMVKIVSEMVVSEFQGLVVLSLILRAGNHTDKICGLVPVLTPYYNMVLCRLTAVQRP